MRRSGWAFFALFSLLVTGCLDQSDFDTGKQLTEDIQTIDNFLASSGITAIKDPSGVRFHLDVVGTGFPPNVSQTVKINYTGKFLNGTVFDAGPTITSPLGSFILGWQYGISVWPKGSKGTLYVPSPLGYGNSSTNSVIPPNSILVFDVELADVVLSNAEKARFTNDTTAIATFLQTHEVNAIKDSTGIAYVITDPGEGDPPTWYQQVKFNYTGKALTTGNTFFTGVATPSDQFSSRVVDFINGIKFGLRKIGKGGKITVYIPSIHAFGPSDNSTTSLPANSNVIYDLELTDIVSN
ncbi:MAG: FKBP-type peptidyl-prolyl cis-trans isomerase [Bacteroidota bacterium]